MIDHVALLPAYLAAATAVLVLLVDLLAADPTASARRTPVLAVAAVGAVATAAAAVWVAAAGPARATFCGGRPPQAVGALPDCSYLFDRGAAALVVLFAGLTVGVLALSVPALRAGEVPAGEYCFLLTCSMTGGVVLAGAGDLITLIVALETLTLPLYVLVGLRRQAVASAEAAVTFFVVSVVSAAVSLLGAGLLYAATGAVHFGLVESALGAGVRPALDPLVVAGGVLLIIGLAFKVAAVPLHAWAPTTYDGAPLPIAAYLSTASKLGGVIALLYVVGDALGPRTEVAGPALAMLAVATMTVGNLVALRQRRMVRLLAWSSVAQAGYILAPLGAVASAPVARLAPTALAYAVFFVLLELAAFAAVIALRGRADGGEIVEYRGAARRSPWVAAALALALIGLAGLPPGLAGLFAKVVVVRSLLGGGAGWLAVIVALNAVIGLAYYVPVAASLFAPAQAPLRPRPSRPRAHWAVAAVVVAATVVGLVAGFAPQLVLDVTTLR